MSLLYIYPRCPLGSDFSGACVLGSRWVSEHAPHNPPRCTHLAFDGGNVSSVNPRQITLRSAQKVSINIRMLNSSSMPAPL